MVPTPRAIKATFSLLGTVFTLSCTASNDLQNKPDDGETGGNGVDSAVETLPLVEFDRWVLLDPALDPSPSHRTSEHSCDPGGVIPEEDVLEVNTNDCGYAVVGQPSLHPIVSGDNLELLMYHSALSAIDEPAEGHFSVWIGSTLLWEINVDIPAAAEIYVVPLTADFDADEGTNVRIHLHNHGGNSWRVAYLRRSL